MKFVRTRLDGDLDRAHVRTVAAREGWLVETASWLRAGWGGTVQRVALESESNSTAAALLGEHSLSGDEGPAGSGVVAFGSLPFDRDAPAELHVPRYSVSIGPEGTWVTGPEGEEGWREALSSHEAPEQEQLGVRSLTMDPSPEEYAHRVAQAVDRLRRKELVKVVLARAVGGRLEEVVDPAALAQRLRRREPTCTLYSLPTMDGRRFVGASPELLVRRRGATVESNPLAGTITLPSGVDAEDYRTWLLGSAKNLHEHAVLVDEVVRQLAERFEDVRADSEPSIVALRSVAHLGTWIRAQEPLGGAPDALEVVRLIHPTPAVGGLPRDDARRLITELEERDRGHYAGPLGWVDERGDGEWWLGIRGVILDEDRFEAWAGAGIVSESDPIAEREETRDKLLSVLNSLLVDRL